MTIVYCIDTDLYEALLRFRNLSDDEHTLLRQFKYLRFQR